MGLCPVALHAGAAAPHPCPLQAGHWRVRQLAELGDNEGGRRWDAGALGRQTLPDPGPQAND